MPLSDLPRQVQLFEIWREAQDTRVRTRLGGIYYTLAWLLTWLFSESPGDMKAEGALFTIVFVFLLVLRLQHNLPGQHDRASLNQWLSQHWVLILLTALIWGLLHAWAIVSPQFESSRLVATISTLAFSTAMAFNFPMRRLSGMLGILLLYVPGLAMMASDWDKNHALFITMVTYLSYLLLVVNRSHGEYQTTLQLERALLEQRERFDQLSRTDTLTQLGNRLQFNGLFPTMVASAQRQGSPLALVLIDIDYFKRINDEHGHSSGDICLHDFAERMRRVFRRDSDALLRLGGEEFGVLMHDTTLEQAQSMAEAFRKDLENSGISLHGRQILLTASLGVGCYDLLHDGSAEVFFKRVDDALYRAKAEGRNRLVLAG
ncbi:GGDEF domain-containing protein [Pseudomonas sp. LRF_L74]|uniref:GGDEF domain-containing protein n=1 Tax=Pseudomonas sp. LRF_L74 TaxID=3369422 RepID=UPI003F5EBE55